MKTKILFFFFLFINTISFHVLSQDFWEEVFTSGPTIFSMDISDDGVIYLGTANGIWKSFDNGDNWEFDTISPGNLVVYSLETKPEGIVYAGCNNRIFYSEDFGDSWDLIYDGIIVSNIVSLCCTDDIILAGTWNGILKSVDNGISWDHVLNLNSGAEAIECIIDYQSSGEYYAGSVPFLSLVDGGLYKSEDFRETWDHLPITYHFGVKDISINSSGKLICAVIWDPDWIFGGIYEYDPFGNTWQCLKYGERGSAIVVNKTDDYYAGIDNELSNGGCRVSYDNGDTWESINYGLSNSNIKMLKITPDGYLFSVANSPSKVFRSIEPTFTSTAEFLISDNVFTVFPNPSLIESGIYIKIDYSGEIEFELFDTNGKLRLSKFINITIDNLHYIETKNSIKNKGVYFYKVKISENELLSGKLIVTK